MPSKFSYQPCREFNVVVLGAGGVGKSCLTAQFVHNEWIESYDPTIEDSYRTQRAVDGRQVMLEILDTAGTEQFGGCHSAFKFPFASLTPSKVAMRDLYMKTGQGFLLVFSIASRTSFEELETLRDDIIRIKDDEDIPIVIVGNKADLEDQRAVDRAKAFSLSQRWSAPYYEASARTRTNVDEAFIDLCRQMLRRDDNPDDMRDDPYPLRADDPAAKRRRRKRRKEKCAIL
ncbi:P-loop containing nucleoside triphosphate hydrolase protein [Chaetomium tenue]|uniref:P-loop containing nucleoside triphosphate hydrolase protein n=1 Tax=Chaetomium tenue TaxID=1854479 RepID=A0ACB7P9C3_9PEZI|nr:P-loop containing nucleoside triphosphate hydrolase protein [Chaetomium globosum]